MIVKDSNYWIISKNSNFDYSGQDVSPDWTVIGTFMYHPHAGVGGAVEPHYHDADEIWIIGSGRGEAWIDDQTYEVTPNTVVYTPMGAVHRRQMFTEFDDASVVTRLERQKRADHLHVEVHGPPVPTVPGFVIPGAENHGPIADRGDRCPFSELRIVDYGAGEGVEEARLSANEHWLVETGSVHLAVDGFMVAMESGDVAMLRSGAVRSLTFPEGALVALARE